MTSFSCALAFLTAACLVLGSRVLYSRPRRRSQGFVVIAPQYRAFFRRLGATEAAHFLALAGETPHIVSGHPDRNVARICFDNDGEPWYAFLKREHRVTRRYRLANALAGFGLASRSLREATILQMLRREDQPGPEWLAAGEDGQGRAFLLLREVPGTELRAFLQTETHPAQRRRLAWKLGKTLARLHSAGFSHPDLYANHLFVADSGQAIHILDWQRASLCRALPWRRCRRDLAALHATVDATLASPLERLICLRAYWRSRSPFGVTWRKTAASVEKQARRLLELRHIREKRQPPGQPQAWICLDGEALCVAPIWQQRCGTQHPEYLPSVENGAGVRRRWSMLADGGCALLVQRNQKPKRRSVVSPEQRQAALLLRLQRHNILAPQVLAVGKRSEQNGSQKSFILTEPLTDTCSLEAWLAQRVWSRRTIGEAARRWSVLRQAGALLQRLHEADCYLTQDDAGCGLAVSRTGAGLTVGVERIESIIPRRRRQPQRMRRDVEQFQQMLRALGCSRTDLCRFRVGYRSGFSPARRETAAPQAKPRMRGAAVEKRFVSAGDFLWRRLLFGVRRWCQRADWPGYVGTDWPERIMDLALADRFQSKQGRSSARWLVETPTQCRLRTRRLSVFLKRHYTLSRWRGWLAALWPWRSWSPAWQEWQQLQWARRQGLSVPLPIAVAEYLGPWDKLRSVLVVEELTGMLSLQEAIPLAALRQDAAAFRRWKTALVAEIARLTRMLHDRHCFHKDLYLCHFFIARDDTRSIPVQGWHGRLYMIDLHRLGHHSLTRKIWQTKDLAQLLYSSHILGVEMRDRLAFWRAYRGEGPQRPRYLWLRRFILYRWRRYRHHNARTQPG